MGGGVVNYLNQQAQLFLVAALLMLAGCTLLYVALAFWAWSIDKFFRIIAVHAALVEFIWDKKNRTKWWNRLSERLRAMGIRGFA